MSDSPFDIDESELVYKHFGLWQTLDRASENDAGDRIFLKKEAYIPTVHEWDGIPIVYATEHPDYTAFAEDPEKELERIKGRVIGKAKNPYIETKGHPTLRGDLLWNDDEVEQLYNEGKLSMSTGFGCPHDRHILQGIVKPQHILVFNDHLAQPGDKGSFILTTEKINEVHQAIETSTPEQLVEAYEIMEAESSVMVQNGEWVDGQQIIESNPTITGEPATVDIQRIIDSKADIVDLELKKKKMELMDQILENNRKRDTNGE